MAEGHGAHAQPGQLPGGHAEVTAPAPKRTSDDMPSYEAGGWRSSMMTPFPAVVAVGADPGDRHEARA